ncbi:MAG: primosomal protein N' [Alistipes sp.]|nr:primosomal protein N' [Alistipes sp.]
MLYAQVVLPLAQPMYTFSLNEGLGAQVGDAVVVQFGSSRFYTGIVWSITEEKPDYPRLKPILKKLYSTPLITPAMQRLWEWIAEYYMCTLGEVMRVALPSLAKPSATSLSDLDERSIEPPTERYIALTNELRTEEALAEYVAKHSRRAPRRCENLDTIAALAMERNAEDGFVPRRLLSIDNDDLITLRKKSLIRTEERVVQRVESSSEFLTPTLSEAQNIALNKIREAHENEKVTLLHGVTGSGKTEIYIHLIAETLAQGRDVLMLVPEIVITSQLVERLEHIFDGRTTTYHSRLTALRRGQTFLRLASSSGGELIVGVRSAIFLPAKNLGLIIVDEEHDGNYKQSDLAPRYNARDCAVVMGRIYGANVVLGSATPSLESYMNSLAEKYAYVELTERWGEGVLPEVVVSDTIRAVKRGERKTHFNFDLLNDISRTLAAKEQVMLFQNRRGYSPYIQCRTCGYSPRCPHCNVTLTQHKASSRMECHYCGYTMPTPSVCPNCDIQDMALMGFGTEKAVEEIARLYPEARVDRLDSDTSTSERAFKQIVHNFEAGETDILVGTQIITKGFDFKGVSTVGILNADNLFSVPDFRASERAFQLMMQVAGRAGRHNDRGRVVIQTSQPKHPVITYVATGDYHAMAHKELEERRAFGYPPYSHLIRIMLRHADYELLRHAAHHFATLMRKKFGSRVMGPVSSALEMLRGEHRAEIMIKIESGASMQRARKMMREAMADHSAKEEFKGVKITIDVDA